MPHANSTGEEEGEDAHAAERMIRVKEIKKSNSQFTIHGSINNKRTCLGVCE